MEVFESKLAALRQTYEGSTTIDVEALAASLRAGLDTELVAIASGGSLVTAKLLAQFAQSLLGRRSRAVTPLEFVLNSTYLPKSHVWLVSAEGVNPDVLAAIRSAIDAEAARISVVTCRRESPLVRIAQEARADIHVLEAAKDGFLATHSIVAVATALLRAVAVVAKRLWSPPHWEDLNQYAADARSRAARLFSRSLLVLLEDPFVHPAGYMLETNMWEADLGMVQLTDLRNFAHGRHLVLARRPDQVGLLAMTTTHTAPIWLTLSSLIPASALCTEIRFEGDLLDVALFSLVVALHLTAAAGDAARLDPGRPNVPSFGRHIFSATDLWSIRPRDTASPAIVRKRYARLLKGQPTISDEELERSREQFASRLEAAEIRALIFDYDGTVVETQDRWDPPLPEILREISRFVAAGLVVAFASGRGGSIGQALREHLPAPHTRVLCGYYNGGVILPLHDTTDPATAPAHPGIQEFEMALDAIPELVADRRPPNPCQLSLVPPHGVSPVQLRNALNALMDEERLPHHRVVCSAHSVDVLWPGVGKKAVLREVQARFGISFANALAIGDSGDWPGNDAELLGVPLSLSVDRISGDLATCWNLLTFGCRGPAGTLAYLRAIEVQQGIARFRSALLPGWG